MLSKISFSVSVCVLVVFTLLCAGVSGMPAVQPASSEVDGIEAEQELERKRGDGDDGAVATKPPCREPSTQQLLEQLKADLLAPIAGLMTTDASSIHFFMYFGEIMNLVREENENCSTTAGVRKYQDHLGNNSICPYEYVRDFDEHRFPSVLREASFKGQTNMGKPVPTTLCRDLPCTEKMYCIPIWHEIPVLRRLNVCNNRGFFAYRPEMAKILVGYTASALEITPNFRV